MALTVDDFADVQSALWKAKDKWFNIGLRLGLKVTTLKDIDLDKGSLEEKLREMILKWLNLGQQCTWTALGEALKHHTVELPELARMIKESHESKNYFVQCMFMFRLYCSLSMQIHTICSQSGTLVDGGGSTGDGAVHDENRGVTSKEGATSADLNECDKSSGKHLKLDYAVWRKIFRGT